MMGYQHLRHAGIITTEYLVHLQPCGPTVYVPIIALIQTGGILFISRIDYIHSITTMSTGNNSF